MAFPPVTLVFRAQRIHLPFGVHEIGRAEACTIVLDDLHVSRRHAKLEISEREVVVSDIGSRGGTRINGARLIGPHVARMGDVLTLGKQSFEFVDSHRTNTNAAGAPALHGFVSCSGCGYLVIRALKWCPVCNFALSFDDEKEDTTTGVRTHHPMPTQTLPIPRAAIILTRQPQMLRGLNEWIATTGDPLVMVFPGLDRARAQINTGRSTVIVDLELVDQDQGAGLKDLIEKSDPAVATFVVMGPPDVDWPARAASYGISRGVRGYVPRLASPIDLLARLHHLRLDDEA
jgi:hypothetical protein